MPGTAAPGGPASAGPASAGPASGSPASGRPAPGTAAGHERATPSEGGVLAPGLVGGLLAGTAAAGAALQTGTAAASRGPGPVLVVAVLAGAVALAWSLPQALRAPGRAGGAGVALLVGLLPVALAPGVLLAADRGADGLATALAVVLPLALVHQLVRRPRPGAAASLASTVAGALLAAAPAAWLVVAVAWPARAAAGLSAVAAAVVALCLVDLVRPSPPRGSAVGALPALLVALAAGTTSGLLLAVAAADPDLPVADALVLGVLCAAAAVVAVLGCRTLLAGTRGPGAPAGRRLAPLLAGAALPLSLAAGVALALPGPGA